MGSAWDSRRVSGLVPMKELRAGRDTFRKFFLIHKLPCLHPGDPFEVPSKVFVQSFFKLDGDHFDYPGDALGF